MVAKEYRLAIPLAVMLLSASQFVESARAAAGVVVNQKNYVILEGMTDASGGFDAPHGLSLAGGKIIIGVIASVRNKANDSWYTVYATGGGSRIAWNDKKVSIRMSDPQFQNQPVRILIFTMSQVQ